MVPHPDPQRRRLGVALLLAFTALLAGCVPSERPAAPPVAVPPPPEKLVLRPLAFAALAGWREDGQGAALEAFKRSCRRMVALDDARPMGGDGAAGSVGDWKPACRAAERVGAGDAAARDFFETEFTPFAATSTEREAGLFTGYYEIELKGSRRRSARFSAPIYRRPDDMINVDLGLFRDSLKGQTLTGKVVGTALRPYDDRATIEGGTLRNRNLELIWAEDPVAVFFLQIQGSGRVTLEDGTVFRVGYAAQNGHGYVPIGRPMRERGLLPPDDVSMQSIRAWLKANPAQAAAVMNENPSYVFFREITGEGPIGSQGVALTPGRSLAVDRAFHAMGTPVWLDATHPAATPGAPPQTLRRLLIAQDTGGAIRGAIRGDVFWGHGAEAEEIAGRMKDQGRVTVLLPRLVAARRVPGS
ncbi:MAG: murein transglycosylase [Alphaproteobacteria bacterium]|nr:murein transglycosylase [Alphaproteobacteria bacterium]